MGNFVVDADREPGVLHLKLSGAFTDADMAAFVEAHNRAVDATTGDYRVFCDIVDLKPLPPSCAALFEGAKRKSAMHPHFQGSAVWISSALVALQHQRTSQDGGVLDTELISDDLPKLRAHLERIRRTS